MIALAKNIVDATEERRVGAYLSAHEAAEQAADVIEALAAALEANVLKSEYPGVFVDIERFVRRLRGVEEER